MELSLKPIGFIRNDKSLKYDARHQPDHREEERSVIELRPGHNFEQALSDLKGFDYIWLVWWFHKNKNWKPKVMPPRGKAIRRGVFATRSPHRPNPIGISAVPLIDIKGRKLIVGSNDLLDGTPILDIKPYLTTADCFPAARQGWLHDLSETPRYTVALSPLAASQLEWLESQKIDLMKKAAEILQVDPTPHRTRRISFAKRENLYRMGCGAWRLYYNIKGRRVQIQYVSPGYPARSLRDTAVPQRKSQLQFLKLFKTESNK